MTGDAPSVHLVPWTIPKPMGLWYRAFVLTEKGVFVTPEIDFTSLEALKVAVDGGLEQTLTILAEHGRNKRPQFVPLDSITGIAANESAGTVHIKVADSGSEDPMVRIPRRDQLPKIAAAVGEFVKRTRAAA